MKKRSLPIIIRCAVCEQEQGSYDSEKHVPKAFVCKNCGTGQRTTIQNNVGFIAGRNQTGHILPPGR